MKYKLKEMSNTVVNLRTQEEYDEYGKMCDDAGWTWCTGDKFDVSDDYSKYDSETCIEVKDKFTYCYKSYFINRYKIITLDELKELIKVERDLERR